MSDDDGGTAYYPAPPGLCGGCRNARSIVSGKGAAFLLCELASVDPRYRKYPPLPVHDCNGFRQGTAGAG